jgi:predicted esterase YcpF (UPF0227 family)
VNEQVEINCLSYSIFGDLYIGSQNDTVSLILPGYTSTKKDQRDFANAMVNMTGYSALVIEYSGHGESQFELKNTSPAQHILEVVSSYDWLVNKFPDCRINVIGTSYGGFLGSHLSLYRNINQLVLRAPAIYQPQELYTTWAYRLSNDVAYATKIKEYRQNSIKLANHPLLARENHTAKEVLVVVHENDEIVPTQTTDSYIKAFNADSYLAKNFSHSTTYSPVSDQQLSSYREYIANWLIKNN